MMFNFKSNILFFLSAVALLSACGKNYTFEGKKDIPNGQWTYRDSVEFSFNIQDTTTLYNMYLDLGVDKSFATQNLYLSLNTGFPNGKRETAIRTFDIYDAQGSLLGDRSGDKSQQRIVLQENAYFNQPGTYTFTVKQFMRRDSLAGVGSVGLVVEGLEKKR